MVSKPHRFIINQLVSFSSLISSEAVVEASCLRATMVAAVAEYRVMLGEELRTLPTCSFAATKSTRLPSSASQK